MSRPSTAERSYPPRSMSTGAASAHMRSSLAAAAARPSPDRAGSSGDGGSSTRAAEAQAAAKAASRNAETTINRVTYKVSQPCGASDALGCNRTQRTGCSGLRARASQNSTIKALIDPTLPVADVIRQLCANAHLGVQEPPALFALRDEEDEELVDDANMARKIAAGRNFK
jgi:hypothetical protein